MCGIAGAIGTGVDLSEVRLRRLGREMTDVLLHRGPDDSGIWVDANAGIVLGHRRLAIIDLSREGHQPMSSASGRFMIAYNGEIYNFRTLKRELEDLGSRFRGHSDTEVLLAAVDRWGVEATLPKLAGMFAFALWDRDSRALHLLSDRLGKKPLYFGWIGSDFVFASELKAFHRHPRFAPEVDRDALTLLLRHGCIPSPYTIYKGISKLPPASHVTLPFADRGEAWAVDPLARLRPYWSLLEIAEKGTEQPFPHGPEAAVDALDEILGRATAERMVADVPLGALLSGGIDSSVVVALMQKQSTKPVKTFSIGFDEATYDEASDAKRVARHLGSDHTELYVTPEQARAAIPRLPDVYDEPFGDRSQIPSLLVAQLARQEVTVAMSGDGGDEVFGGYNRHFYGPWLWQRIKPWPAPLLRGAAAALTAISPGAWDAAARRAFRLLPRSSRQPMPGYRIHKLADLLTSDSPDAIYRRLTSYWHDPADLVIDAHEPPTVLTNSARTPLAADFTSEMMYLDGVTYLPDDILVKVDRASMAVSLEVRAPLLDHRVVEFAWSLPGSMKIRQRQGKWILRQVLDRYVPRQLVDRPKQGFDVPIDAWLRGPLRDWAESMLEPGRLAREGFLRPEPIQAAWVEHLSGTRDRAWALWPILMFQTWQDRWGCSPRDDSLGRRSPVPPTPEAVKADALDA